MDFGDFDDDLFDSKPRKKTEDLTEIIKGYKPKIVTAKKFLDEKPTETDDLANWVKMKGDFDYFNKNYENSLQLYKESLEISIKSTSLNNTIFQRELNESISRCFFKLNKIEEALDLIIKLEETSTNFEQYSTSLNLHLNLLENINQINEKMDLINDQIKVICRLITMHPLYITLWMKLGDLIMLKLTNSKSTDLKDTLKLNLIACILILKVIIKYPNSNKNEIVSSQKIKQNKWIEEKIKEFDTLSMNNIEKYFDMNQNLILQNEISQKLETNDKFEDNEKMSNARCLEKHEIFFNSWLSINLKF